MSRSRVIWFLVLGCLPGIVWAQGAASPKASPRASTRAAGSPSGANKKSGTEKGTADKNAADKKGGGAFGSDDSENKGPTEITAKQEVDFDGNNHTAIFVGNVKVIDPQFTMTTDKLTVWMNKQEDGGGIKEAQADGNVIIVHANPPKNNTQTAEAGASPRTSPVANSAVTPEGKTFGDSGVFGQATPSASPSVTPPVLDTGRAQKAIYNAKQDAVTLIGWPQVTQGVNTHIATEEGTRMILYRDGRLQTFGPSRTVIEDKKTMQSPSPSPGEPQLDPNNSQKRADPNNAQKNNAIH
jgi:lipopolysaccharide export system protein LptA